MISRELAWLIEETRAILEDAIPLRLHLRDPIIGDPRPFTRRFANYIDHPPDILTILRRRRYPLVHYRRNHQKGCGCRKRIGYRLVWDVVVQRSPLGLACSMYHIEERMALLILANELRTIHNEYQRWKSHYQK